MAGTAVPIEVGGTATANPGAEMAAAITSAAMTITIATIVKRSAESAGTSGGIVMNVIAGTATKILLPRSG